MQTKPAYFYNQSGVIPYRISAGELGVLLISSRKGTRWVIPKGVIEPDLSPTASAAKEALEEAGIEGLIHPVALGSYQRQKWGGTCTVEVFVMAVKVSHDAWEESYRERRWTTIDNAIALVEEQGLKQLLGKMSDFLISEGVIEQGV